jgi:hypothetical protein
VAAVLRSGQRRTRPSRAPSAARASRVAAASGRAVRASCRRSRSDLNSDNALDVAHEASWPSPELIRSNVASSWPGTRTSQARSKLQRRESVTARTSAAPFHLDRSPRDWRLRPRRHVRSRRMLASLAMPTTRPRLPCSLGATENSLGGGKFHDAALVGRLLGGSSCSAKPMGDRCDCWQQCMTVDWHPSAQASCPKSRSDPSSAHLLGAMPHPLHAGERRVG